MYCIQFDNSSIHTKSRFIVLVWCFRFLLRQVPAGCLIYIFKY